MPYTWSCAGLSTLMPKQDTPAMFGYIFSFAGLGMTNPLKADLTSYTNFNTGSAAAYTLMVPDANKQVYPVAVLNSISWGGNMGDGFQFDCYMSQANASVLKSLKTGALLNDGLTLGWWVGDFQQANKVWFEVHYPLSTITTQGGTPATCTTVNGKISQSQNLKILGDPFQAGDDGSGPWVQQVKFPLYNDGAASYNFNIASSPTLKNAVPWGMIITSQGGT